MLTQETRLLIEHWPAVEEIIQSESNLRTQLSDFLGSLKNDLNKTDWWSDGWNFVRQSDDQVYIAHDRWRKTKEEFAVWIGVERFGPPVLFGKEVFAQLYVWTTVPDKQFITKARQVFKSKKTLGTVEEKNSSYIIKDFLPKILPTQSNEFEKIIRDKVIGFFSFYAKEENAITELVTGHKKGK